MYVIIFLGRAFTTEIPENKNLVDDLYARYLCDALGLKPMQPVGQARRATIGYLVYK